MKSTGIGWNQGLVLGFEHQVNDRLGWDWGMEIRNSGDTPMKLTSYPSDYYTSDIEKSISTAGLVLRMGIIYYPFQSREDTIWTRPLR